MDFKIDIDSELTKQWFDFYTRCTHYDEPSVSTHHQLFKNIGPKTGFAFLKIRGQAAAIGLGVIEREWVGVFCMQTLPDFRRQGAASAVLYALASWGLNNSASQAYLRVMEDNPPALNLYSQTSFKKLYHYYYAEGLED
ncbi:MAG: GNAT family N-acetyltransferase [Chloroflexi bacterium]|nr:GNAT family N-acetyltransferase [Chloroflexota bacterium]